MVSSLPFASHTVMVNSVLSPQAAAAMEQGCRFKVPRPTRWTTETFSDESQLTTYFTAGMDYAVGAAVPQQAQQFTLPCHVHPGEIMFWTCRQQASLREQQDPKDRLITLATR